MKQVLIFLVGCLIGVGVVLLVKHNEPTKVPYESIINTKQHTIDSLEVCIQSIKTRIDTLYIEKTKIIYRYEEKANTVWNQSTNDDWVYFQNFLCTRFPNNIDTTKTN